MIIRDELHRDCGICRFWSVVLHIRIAFLRGLCAIDQALTHFAFRIND
jgi:hypothetical protein